MEGILLRRALVGMRYSTDNATSALLHENVPCGHENKDGFDQRYLQEVSENVQLSEERIDRRRNCKSDVRRCSKVNFVQLYTISENKVIVKHQNSHIKLNIISYTIHNKMIVY